MDIHTDIVYSHTGYYDVIIYFRSEVIAIKTVEKYIALPTTSGGSYRRAVQARMTNFNKLLEDNLPHKLAGYDVTSCFQSAFVEGQKPAENAASDIFVCNKSNAASKDVFKFIE